MIRQRITGNNKEFFDPVRKKWVPATPEEEVRQQFIQFLLTVKNIPASHLSVEREIAVNGLSRRYDLVVFDGEGKPWMVVECKAPHVKLTQEVMEQAGRYNRTLQAPLIGITNGKENKFFRVDFETGEIVSM
ncbi:MAG: type I restriction enzyme HsdR N-terminal domain-containing protein [Bacteroidales bacterium]|nr:type I restriction enzyme HsdR N-terminal domain-containing protein [Bacteroidales bacterium]